MARKRQDQEHYGTELAVTDADLPESLQPTATLPAEPHTLAQILDDLLAWEDTLALADTDEQRAEITTAIVARQSDLIGKVDRFAAVMRRLEHEAAWEESEEKRHLHRKRRYMAAYARLEGYAIAAMQHQNVRKLEGQGAALKLRLGSGAVLITDEQLVSEEFKNVTVTMPLRMWEALMETNYLDKAESAQIKASISIPKEPVKKAIKSGVDVPGADIVYNDSLQLE